MISYKALESACGVSPTEASGERYGPSTSTSNLAPCNKRWQYNVLSGGQQSLLALAVRVVRCFSAQRCDLSLQVLLSCQKAFTGPLCILDGECSRPCDELSIPELEHEYAFTSQNNGCVKPSRQKLTLLWTLRR